MPPSTSFSALLPALGAAALAGAALAAQPGVNGTLGRRLSHPIHASLVSFVGGITLTVLLCLVWAKGFPKPGDFRGAAWWEYAGGVLGVLMVTCSLVFAPRVGGATWLALLVAAQLSAALVLDHFGLVGYPVRPVTAMRVLGVALVAGGAVLVTRS